MLQIESLTKVYGNTTDSLAGGIREAEFSISPGTFFTLLGPSGCGKTTTLRCVAGLEKADSGRVSLDDRVLFDGARRKSMPIERRNIGMVFQSYAIWPHMTVAENVAFPLRVSKERSYSATEIRDAVARALKVVSLDGYQERSATQLSGGQQQRVALARAIVRAPSLLLLDEPLSNLDAQLREEMRVELMNLQQKIGITTIYVTHDQSEALALSDQVAVINKGRVVQLGTPREIYYRPANSFVAHFVGTTNLLPGQLRGVDDGFGEARVLDDQAIRCIVPGISAPETKDLLFSVRPEAMRILGAGEEAGEGANTIEGRVVSVAFLGQTCRVDVVSNDKVLQVTAPGNVDLPADTPIRLAFSPEDTVAVPAA